jgi:hypothetical protein
MDKADALPTRVDPNDVAAVALQAIDSVTNLSNQYMTYTTWGLALFSLVGLGVIFGAVRYYAKDASRTCANEHMQKYISNGEAKELLAQLIDEAVQKQLSKRIFTAVHPAEKTVIDGGPRFTVDPRIRRPPQ